MATSEQKSGTIFHGWWIVLVAGIGLSIHSAPIMTFTAAGLMTWLGLYQVWEAAAEATEVAAGVARA